MRLTLPSLALITTLGIANANANANEKLKIDETATVNGTDVTGTNPTLKGSDPDGIFSGVPEFECMVNPTDPKCIEDPEILRIMRGRNQPNTVETVKGKIFNIANKINNAKKWLLTPGIADKKYFEISSEGSQWDITARLPKGENSFGCFVNITTSERNIGDTYQISNDLQIVMKNGTTKRPSHEYNRGLLINTQSRKILNLSGSSYNEHDTRESFDFSITSDKKEGSQIIEYFQQSVCDKLREKLTEVQKADSQKLLTDEDDEDLLFKKILKNKDN